MKRFLLFTLVIGLFAVQANADLWELDKDTALWLRTYTDVDGPLPGTDTVGSLSVYDGPSNEVYDGDGGALYGAADMSGAVGFVANFSNQDLDPTVVADISYTGTLSLVGTTLYDGIKSYVQNDNNSLWTVQMFYEAGGSRFWSAPASLPGQGGATYLSVYAPGGPGSLNLGTITDIGFRISAYMDGKGLGPTGNPSSPDAFHISVVPVPAAVILGVLGLAVVGVKLRKYA